MAAIHETECNDPVSWGYFVHGSLIPAGVIILILSHMQRRSKPNRADDCCHKNFALIFPLNLIDDCQHRVAYSLAFGASASLLLDLFFGSYAQYYAASVDEFWVKILIGGLATIEIGISCYPYFACITTPSRLTGSALGFLYVSFWFGLQLTLNIMCPDRPDSYFRYQSLVAQFPVLICMFLLDLYFLFTFIYVARLRWKNIKVTIEEKMMATHHAIHVKQLFKKPVQKVYTGWEAKVYDRYTPVDGFKYPTRICATFVVAVICMYQLSLPMIAGGRDTIINLFYFINSAAPSFYEANNFTEGKIQYANMILGQTETAADVSLVIGSCIALFLQLVYVGHIFICYRKHVLRLYRGDRLFLPDNALTSKDVIVGNLKYCGYQIAYFLSGYIIVTYVLFALVMIVSTVIVMPLINNANAVFLLILNVFVPAAIIGAIVFSSQNILARFYFLQPKLNETDKDKPVALQHRQWYHNFSYFLVFLNTLLGLVSAFVRIIRGILLGLFLLSRIDRPVLMRGYEIKDNAYKVYVGNLNMINQHSHPVLIVFCQLLINEYILPGRTKKYTSRRPGHEVPNNAKKKAAIFRWHLAYTILNNPRLIGTRKRSRALSFNKSHGGLQQLADPDNYRQLLMPHAQQLLIRTHVRKGEVTEVDGVTLDDLVLNESFDPSSPLRSRLLAESFSMQPRGDSFRGQQSPSLQQRGASVKGQRSPSPKKHAENEGYHGNDDIDEDGEDSDSKQLQNIV